MSQVWPQKNMVTRFRSLSRRVYVTPLCKPPRSIKMWVKPKGNPEMVVEKETLEISYDRMASSIYESNEFLHKSSYHKFSPHKRGSNILQKLLPDLIQVDLSCTRCGLCSIIQVSLAIEEIRFMGNLLFLTPPAINPFWKLHLVWISAELSPNINDLKIFNLLPDNQTGPWN